MSRPWRLGSSHPTTYAARIAAEHEHDPLTAERKALRPTPVVQPGEHIAAPGLEAVERAAATLGNANFSAAVAGHGAGILPSGRAHPDVEAAIARTRGHGSSLPAATKERFAPALGDLDDVRVHDDATATSLARSVSARAFTTGSDVYFGEGEYRPGSGDGDRLLAHELTHVVQQRGAPHGGALAVSEPGDALETEAEAATGELAG